LVFVIATFYLKTTISAMFFMCVILQPFTTFIISSIALYFIIVLPHLFSSLLPTPSPPLSLLPPHTIFSPSPP
jgi:hypothetical protein